ncbi:MAG TPA: class I tRNA ligase family protein, partial [Allocoleopsis sp.]
TEITTAFENYEFSKFFQIIQNFCVVDLSNFYLDMAKDRLYISHAKSFRRRSCQTVISIALENLAKAISPVLCHLAEDIWQFIPYPKSHKSIFQAGWVELKPEWNKPELGQKWEKIRQIRTEVNKVLQQARTEKVIGSSLESKVLIYVADLSVKEHLTALNTIDESGEPWHIHEVDAPPVINVSKPMLPAKDWNQIINDVLAPFSKSPGLLRYFLTEYKGLVVFSLFLLVAFLPLRLMLAVLEGVNSIPLLGGFFELLGMVVTGRYFVNPQNRKDFAGKLQWLMTQVFTQLSKFELEKAPTPEIDATPVINPPELEKEHLTPPKNNHVDQLRYLFLASQVELLDSAEKVASIEHKLQTESLCIAVVNADGEKCDRCWNYSLKVGESKKHPLICERCNSALSGEF